MIEDGGRDAANTGNELARAREPRRRVCATSWSTSSGVGREPFAALLGELLRHEGRRSLRRQETRKAPPVADRVSGITAPTRRLAETGVSAPSQRTIVAP